MKCTFSAVAFAVLSFGAIACASPIEANWPVDPHPPYAPPVREPREGDVWCVGERRTVRWDTSNPQTNITNPYGQVVLMKGNRLTNTVLAKGFHLLVAHVQVDVPNVAPAANYRIALIGTPENYGDQFTIAAKGDKRCRH
ncbi:hypothetical protein HGRIS_005292 [Hohenbuehelia grisea]|uniref:Uncharacterized protein n=1 Tax=Hohenbuehelia grisea TaxID=104357 RepID=A0ABR3JEJ7_9AGAR